MALDSMTAQAALPRWCETIVALLRRIEIGTITCSLPDGRSFVAKGPRPGPEGHIHIHNPQLFARIVRDGDLGFLEAYLDGWWDTPDLQALMDVAMLNNDQIGHSFPGIGLVRAYERVRHWLRPNTRRGARRNIAHHYDLGNEFYRLWLDPSMTYSSALFSGQGETLEQAQRNKYASICDRMRLKPGEHVLEIGCGWGGFAEFAARERGVRVTGLTLSREQHDFARRRLFDAGLADLADIVIRDYRDEEGVYDGVASIEMFEAVGERYWPTFFRTVFKGLRPGGSASIQMITIADNLFETYRRSTDFIQKYIFPGGMLAAPSVACRHAEAAGLEHAGSLEFGQSYSRTLREWYHAFNDRWEEIAQLGFDDRFRRMWNMYLTSCAACFAAGTTDVTQISLRRPA